MNFKLITPHTGADMQYSNSMIVDFLHAHLDQYGDAKPDISKCIDYALGLNGKPGGCILLALDNDNVIGAVVTNETGMQGYIPENILVYIAVNGAYRGQGVGKKLIDQIKKVTKGDNALHVEPENPAKRLYERNGFENPYLEMRWKRNH
ncbi:MAG: GNAT family N-acetyltransferase [Bacteroidia bacterium]